MNENDDYQDSNEAKASMDHIYDQRDPRAYFRELKTHGYSIPDQAKPVFTCLIDRLRERRSGLVRVLDLGCSYGVNAALLKHDLSMEKLYDHWSQPRLSDATPTQVVEHYRQFFENLDHRAGIAVLGLDQAEEALDYAVSVGLLDAGIPVNLEQHSLPGGAREKLEDIDLVISTGCVGYVGETTFDKITPAVASEKPAWMCNFVLRMFPFDAIAAGLAKRGYVTEKLAGETFVQRRFASRDEEQQVLDQLRQIGLDPEPEAASGCLLAELYVSRPADDVSGLPLEKLLAASPCAVCRSAAGLGRPPRRECRLQTRHHVIGRHHTGRRDVHAGGPQHACCPCVASVEQMEFAVRVIEQAAGIEPGRDSFRACAVRPLELLGNGLCQTPEPRFAQGHRYAWSICGR